MRNDPIILFIIGVALLTAGLTWLFGPYGLVGSGAALVALALLSNISSDPPNRKEVNDDD